MSVEAMEQVEDQLVKELCKRNGWEYGSNEDYDNAVRDVKWFLSQPEILIKDPDQSLPPAMYEAMHPIYRSIADALTAIKVLRKENWVKVIPKDKQGGKQNVS